MKKGLINRANCIKNQISLPKVWKIGRNIVSLRNLNENKQRHESALQVETNINILRMATAIRVIPTLHGEEARKFIENAEWTERHPGTCGSISKEDAQLLRDYLREMNLA